jgi:hypothetical protein
MYVFMYVCMQVCINQFAGHIIKRQREANRHT